MPPGAVYVGRPTKWGNPHKVGDLIGPFSDGPRVIVRGLLSNSRMVGWTWPKSEART